MYDYLNEYLLLVGNKNRKNNTYKRAMAVKKRGDAFIFNLLCREWCSRYKWLSSEKTIATELIERTILMNGACGISKFVPKIKDINTDDSYATWRNFNVTGTNNLSFYGYPSKVTLTSYNGQIQKTAIPIDDTDFTTIGDCVLIYDNPSRYPAMNTILYYCDKMSLIATRINAAIENILPTTTMIGLREQVDMFIKQRESASLGIPYTITIDDLQAVKGAVEPKLMTTEGAKEELMALFEAFDKVHGDYLNNIGIRCNNEMNKLSGVTPLEVTENRQASDLILNDGLQMRQKAVNQCKVLGVDLRVSLDNFESLTADYNSDGERTQNVDSKASEINKEEVNKDE